MFNNYSFKSSLWQFSISFEKPIEQKTKSNGFAFMVLMFLFAITGIQAQTPRIPSGDGTFSNGSTFAANGWTVANQGTSPVKWALGTAASGTSSVGSTTTALTAVTLTASNPSITVGQIVYGSGIPAGTFVSAIAGTSLTLSQAATLTASGVTFGFGVFSGGISVGTVQASTASIAANTYSVTLAAANPNISVGMAIAPVAGFIGANTYVASINGTALGLSQASINGTALAVAQTMTFSATSSSIAGNAAYVSNNNGATNSYGGYATNRTVYFYRDIPAFSASENAMTLTFDIKSAPASGGGWQVWVAPTSQTVTGTDTQVTTPFVYGVTWPGATLISFNSNPQVSTTKTTAFIPKSFAGTSFRLIFVWTNGTAAGTLPPAAIDNISLTSRISEDITCTHSGLWSQTGTWDVGKVPTPADNAIIDSNAEVVMVDSRYSGCENLFLVGTNTLLQFAISSATDEFTVGTDINIAAGGSRLNNHDGTNGKYLKVGGNFDVGAGARFDSNIGSGVNGRLNLNGTTLQTVTVDPAGFVGGSTAPVNTTSNVSNVLGGLEVTNTSTATPNVMWNANGIRIRNSLVLTSGRVSITPGNRLILGNFTSMAGITCPVGNGFTSGTLSKWINAAKTTTINSGTEYPGSDVSFKTTWYPFVSGANQDRSLYLFPDAAPTTFGEVAINYTDSTTLTGSLSIADGSYTINNRYNGNWAFSTPDSSVIAPAINYAANTTTPTNRVGLFANGAYEALNGTSRLMNASAALSGTHQEGTSQPFVIRTGITMANLTAAPVYVGFNNASFINTTTAITSTLSGGDRNWNTPATWVGGIPPSCGTSTSAIIASGSTVNVTTTADAVGVIIRSGGTLVNNSGATTMTVGCTNNNNAFYNYGTHTMTSGTLKVNGFMSHKLNSTFNQTGGDIIIDSNDNGNAATSVAFGGTSCKIETSNLALTGGKITIVDPLVNIDTPITGTSLSNYTLNTEGATGTFVITTSSILSASTFTTPNAGGNMVSVGQLVTGHPNIPVGTTVLSTTLNGFGTVNTVVLSQPVSGGSIPSGTNLNFSSMINGVSDVVLENVPANANLAVGQAVSGTGITPGSQITVVQGEFGGSQRYKISLSSPVSGLSPNPIAAQQTLTFAAVNVGSNATVLSVANPNINVGMTVTGTGIKPGTFVTNVTGTAITFSENIQPGAPTPLVMNFSSFNTQFSGSFIYQSPINYATGLNHTLQIGDGVSTQNTANISTGFNCQFMSAGGLISLGNLTVNAPNGASRFMTVSNNNINNNFLMNVQNKFTVTAGSVFKKTFGNSTVYVGGDIENNGTINMPWQGTGFYLGNNINGLNAATNLPQTISGSGVWDTNQYALSNGPTGYSLWSLTVNNTSGAGVTLQVPNFRCSSGANLINGIVHTSATYPLYAGISDVTGPFFGGSFSGGNATSFIDGPCGQAYKSDTTVTQFRILPTGKNGKYLPIYISSSGGVELLAEAFDTNAGSINGANGSNLGANRWNVTRVGALGAFTGYNVRVGATPNTITAANNIVHSATANGVYDIVSTPASPAMTFAATTTTTTTTNGYTATIYAPNTIQLTTAQTGGFLGNFAYAEGVACTGTPVPVAAATASTLCAGQPSTLSLTGLTGAGLTYKWQQNTGAGFADISLATAATYVATPSVNTSYRCIVTCAGSPGTSNTIAITVSQSTATTTGATICVAGVANLSAAGSSILNWYTAASGGSLVNTGTTYSPTVAATTTFHVSSASTTAGSAGVGSWTGTASASALFNGIAFDATNQLKLKTVTVYPKNTVALIPVTVALFDASGNIVSGTSPVTFTPTLVTGALGSVSQVVTLNYTIPVGTGYRLVATNGLAATTNTLGNSTTAITYPTSGSLRLTGNVTALNTAIVTTLNTTTYFHNLTFDETCESVTRTPVTATVGCNSIVNLKLFIQGYYLGASTMNSVKLNQWDGVTPATAPAADLVEDLTVELHDATTFALVPGATTTATLKTDGTISCSYPSAPVGSFYVVVKGSNMVETWSANPVAVPTVATYDFSTLITKAYGSNMIEMPSGSGVYGFYSGDINQDESVDGSDSTSLSDDIDNSAFGALATDLNGDGSVDGSDFTFFSDNAENSVFSQHP